MRLNARVVQLVVRQRRVCAVRTEQGEEIPVRKAVLADEYPELAGKIFPSLPDEKFRRVGQSAAAASLPEIN